MSKYLFVILMFGFSFAAHADITCIGKVGKLDTRINIVRDGIDKVEILQAGDSEYIGKYTENRQGVLMGSATSREGNILKFDFEYNFKSKPLSISLGVEDERGNVSGGTLKCVVLE